MEELDLFNKKGSEDSSLKSRDTCSKEVDFEGRNKNKSKRGQWSGRFEFLLAIIGYTVGVGSIWRFPIICAKNGGGAFLIPFVFFLVTCGGPLYYLEVCLGQFSGKSAVLAFELCPLFKGEKILLSYLIYNTQLTPVISTSLISNNRLSRSKNLGPVVQSVVSLTSSFRVISLTVLADSMYNILNFFAEKMWVAFALQKHFSIFAYHSM